MRLLGPSISGFWSVHRIPGLQFRVPSGYLESGNCSTFTKLLVVTAINHHLGAHMVPSHGLEGRVVVLNHLRRPGIVAGVGGSKLKNQVYSDVAKTVFGRVTERFIRFGTLLKYILRPKVQGSIPRACLKFDTS
jgi:hypothetical protein